MQLSSSSSGTLLEEYSLSRERLQRDLSAHLRAAMASLVCNMENADLLLVAADGKKLAAHECILRARAPGFYQRHIEATVAAMGGQRLEPGQLREVAIGDIDSAGLEFFIHSVYTEDEIALFPVAGTSPEEERRDSHSRNSQRSFQMDDSTTDLEDIRSDLEGFSNRSNHTTTESESARPGASYNNLRYNESSLAQGPPQTSQQMQHSLPPHLQHSIIQPLPSHPALSRHGSQPIYATPHMTSFRDLATSSPLNSSVYSLGGRSEIGPDIPEEEEEGQNTNTRQSMGKFIRLDSFDSPPSEGSMERKRSASSLSKAIFPLFIGLCDGDEECRGSVPEGIRGRAIMAKRLSVASLTSLASIDMSSSTEVKMPSSEKQTSCRLASDLLKMYTEGIDTDVVVRTQNGDLFAHKCILSVLSPFFRQQLKKSPKIEMKGYSKSTVHFLLSFFYGGLTSIPEEVDVWEVVSLATHLNLKDLVDVVILHLKMTKCHFFHRPCATCVSAVFDALPQLHSIRCLRPLFDEAMAWQAKHFSRIWKGRVFLHLPEKWQKECCDALVAYMDDETVIDIILGCERLQTALPRCKSEASQLVQSLVNDILDMSLQFLTHSFHLIVTSRAFVTQGKGLALNVGMLEDLLPPLVHSLSADVAIKSYLGLSQLRESIAASARTPTGPLDRSVLTSEESSPRFVQLVQRLYELVDKHLLHFAASVVKAESWSLLSLHDQNRIQETGIFVEMREPRMPPPRLSSLYRTYKRSASAGVQPSNVFFRERNQSIERGRPLSTLQPSAENKEAESQQQLQQKEEPQPKELREKEQQPLAQEALPTEEEAEKEKAPTETQKQRSPDKKPPIPVSSPKRQPNSPTHPGKKEGRRSPIKKKAIETEEGRLERQATHTIITTSDSIKEAAANLPGPVSPKKLLSEKPKSVVKPMQQEPSLAGQKSLPRITPSSSSTPRITPSSSKTARTSAVITGSSVQSKASPTNRSSIPRKAALPASTLKSAKATNVSTPKGSQEHLVKRRPNESSPSTKSSPRSPKNPRKEDLKRQN